MDFYSLTMVLKGYHRGFGWDKFCLCVFSAAPIRGVEITLADSAFSSSILKHMHPCKRSGLKVVTSTRHDATLEIGVFTIGGTHTSGLLVANSSFIVLPAKLNTGQLSALLNRVIIITIIVSGIIIGRPSKVKCMIKMSRTHSADPCCSHCK